MEWGMQHPARDVEGLVCEVSGATRIAVGPLHGFEPTAVKKTNQSAYRRRTSTVRTDRLYGMIPEASKVFLTT